MDEKQKVTTIGAWNCDDGDDFTNSLYVNSASY